MCLYCAGCSSNAENVITIVQIEVSNIPCKQMVYITDNLFRLLHVGYIGFENFDHYECIWLIIDVSSTAITVPFLTSAC